MFLSILSYFLLQKAPAYIGEMSPASIRGLLVSLKEAMIVVGILLGYFVGWLYHDVPGGWRSVYGLSTFLAGIMACGVFYLPPSARWLVLRGKLDEAQKSLEFVHPNISEADKGAVLSSQTSVERVGNEWEQLSNPTWWPALIAGIGLVFLQQVKKKCYSAHAYARILKIGH